MELTKDPKNKVLTVNNVLAELRSQCKLSLEQFSTLMGIGRTSLENIEQDKAEVLLRTVKAIQTLTGWSTEWIVNQEKTWESDGAYDYFLQNAQEFKKSKSVQETFKFAIERTNQVAQESFNTTGSNNQIIQIVGNNINSENISIGNVIFESQLSEKEKIAIIEANHNLKRLDTEIDGLKKLLASKNEIIEALKGR